MDLTKSQRLLYTIIRELGGVDDKVKLAKFEYFSDFIHYAFNNTPISDTTSLYEKRPYGPLARNFNADLAELVSKGILEQKDEYHYSIKKNINPDLNEQELKTVKYVLSKYSNYSYKVLADITHKQIPYLSTNEGGI